MAQKEIRDRIVRNILRRNKARTLQEYRDRLQMKASGQPLPEEQTSAAENFSRAFKQQFVNLGAGLVSISDPDEGLRMREDYELDNPTRDTFSGKAGSILGGIAPTGLALAATVFPEPVSTAAGLAVLGTQAASAGGNAVADIRAYERSTGEDISTEREIATGAGNAAVSAVTSLVGLKGLGGVGKIGGQTLNKLTSIGSGSAEKLIAGAALRKAGKEGATKALVARGITPGRAVEIVDDVAGATKLKGGYARFAASELAKQSGRAGFIEGTEEAAQQIGSNIVDQTVGTRTRTLGSGVGESFKQGFAGGTLLGPLSAFARTRQMQPQLTDAEVQQAMAAQQAAQSQPAPQVPLSPIDQLRIAAERGVEAGAIGGGEEYESLPSLRYEDVATDLPDGDFIPPVRPLEKPADPIPLVRRPQRPDPAVEPYEVQDGQPTQMDNVMAELDKAAQRQGLPGREPTLRILPADDIPATDPQPANLNAPEVQGADNANATANPDAVTDKTPDQPTLGTFDEQARDASDERLNAAAEKFRANKKRLGSKMFSRSSDAPRLKAVEKELARRQADQASKLSDDEWLAQSRFYRSGKTRNAELPDGRRVILQADATNANFREASRDFLLGLRGKAASANPDRPNARERGAVNQVVPPVEQNPVAPDTDPVPDTDRAEKTARAMSTALRGRHKTYLSYDNNALSVGGRKFFTVEIGDTRIAISPEKQLVSHGGEVEVHEAKQDVAWLAYIETPKPLRGKGSASKALNALVKVADAHGVTLYAEPATKGEMSDAQLNKWYAKYGFEPVDDGTVIVREPQLAPVETPTRPNARDRGAVNIEPIAKAVEAAVKAAKTSDIVVRGAEYLGAVKQTFKNITEATKELVARFGDAIRRHVPRIWKQFQEYRAKNQQALANRGTAGQRGMALNPLAGSPDDAGKPDVPPKATEPAQPAQRPVTGKPENNSNEGWQTAARNAAVSRGKAGVMGVVDAAQKGIRYYSETEADTVRRQPGGKQIAAAADRAVDYQKQYEGRIRSETGDKAMRELGRLSNAKAAIELQRESATSGENWRIAKIAAAVEDRSEDQAIYNSLLPKQKRIVDNVRSVVDSLGKLHRDVGVKQNGEDFGYIEGGRIFPRLYSDKFVDIIQTGQNGSAWGTLVDAISEANPNRQRAEIEEYLTDLRENFNNEVPGKERAINAEFRRDLENMPTHITHDGVESAILISDPSQYVRRLVEIGTNRAGFLTVFGTDGKIRAENIASGRKSFTDSGGKSADYDRLIRVLSGRPLDNPIIDPGSPAYELSQGVKNAIGVHKELLLTASGVANIPESVFGGTTQFFGFGRVLKSLRNSKVDGGDLDQSLAAMGAITSDPINMAYEVDRPAASGVRMFREVVGRAAGHRIINEWQERIAARAAWFVAEDLKAGRAKGSDLSAIRAIVKDADLAKRLRDGKGTKAEYEAFIRRASAFLVGSNRKRAEASRASNSRVFNTIFAFNNYAQTRLNQLRSVAGELYEAKKSGDREAMKSASMLAGRFVGWSTVQGASAYFLLQLAFGGLDGLGVAEEEAKDQPIKFLAESFAYATLGGPIAQIYRAAESGGSDLERNLVRGTFPGAVLMESADFLRGEGSYKNQTALEKAETYLTRRIPGARVLSTPAAVLGLSDKDNGLEAAISGYWRWRYSEAKPGKFSPGESDADTQEFRRAMRRAADAIRRNQDPTKHLQDALGVEGKDKAGVKASILSRRLLAPLTDEQITSLRGRIGERAFGKLKAYDTVLEEWAKGI